MALTLLGSAAEVLLATNHDPFARGSLRRPVVSGWMGDGATAWLGTDTQEQVSYLSALGTPEAVGALLADLAPELRDAQQVTLPRGTAACLPAWMELTGVEWDFRWIDVPPPVHPAEQRVTDAGHALVADLLAVANPHASVNPGDPAARRLVGIPGLGQDREGDGRLLACAADTSAATGVGHLSAIAVHPDARGQGLGSAITGQLTRALLAADCDVVTLGMFSKNTAGRALYDGLGFRDDHPFTSGPLRVRSRW